MSVLSSNDIRLLDPYSLLAALGKKVIRPGGCGSSEAIFRLTELHPEQHILDIGCGVGTTAIQIASRFGCRVTAVDIDKRMLEYAHYNIRKTGVIEQITLEFGDIQALPFADDVFDIVTIETVTMFTGDQRAAIREAIRVCKPGGYVFDHEFVWACPPPAELRLEFDSIVCSGMSFETEQEWTELFLSAGQDDIQVIAIPFDLMTIKGMLRDERWLGTIIIVACTLSRQAYFSRMLWLIRVLNKVSPCLSSVVIACKKKYDGTGNA